MDTKAPRTSTRKARIAFLVIPILLAGLSVAASGARAQEMAQVTRCCVDRPIVSCGTATETSISIQVCAPATPNALGMPPSGLPGGFSVRWMTRAEYVAIGSVFPIPSSECEARFTGTTGTTTYNLVPGQCVTVSIGELLPEQGATTTCPPDDVLALECGTEYVFSVHALPYGGMVGSDWVPLSCSTIDCGGADLGNCTFTQGYWKSHGPGTCASGNNTNEWPATSLTLGTVTYTDAQLCSILNTPSRGNGLISLAHQLIAAKLNVLNGADPADIQGVIASADALIGGLVIPPVGDGWLAPTSLTTSLTNFNEGLTGPGHCPVEQ